MIILNNIRKVINTVIKIACILLFGFMVIIGTYQILVRYIFNNPSTISEELLTYSFTWMSLFAAAYVFGKREHMRMGFLADKLSSKKITILNVIIEIITIAFALIVMVYGGVSITSLSMTQKTASLGIPMGYIYSASNNWNNHYTIWDFKYYRSYQERRKCMSIAWLSGLIILVILVIMLIAGAPIAISLAVSSICAILPVLSTEPALITGAQRIFSGISVFNLIAIPFFILAGNIMNRGGIAIKLINFAKIFTGRIPGSLAHTNVVANMLFGAISGSGTAAASAMGAIIGPVEEKEGYDKNFSAAVNIATAPTGLLIPPSNVMITFAMVSGGTSIAALFMAGYIPGILWGIACMVVIYLYAKKRGYTSNKHYALKEKTKIIIEALPCLLMIVIVIGGIIGGIFTATEGAIVAVVYSLILSLVFYKSIKISELPKLLVDSAEMTGIIIFLIGVSSIMSWVMAFTGIPAAISGVMLGISNNKYVILLIINVILLIVGTFMDMTPACLIFTPIFLPICQAIGMNTIHFGIMMIFNLCIGTITPPVGTTLFVGVKVGKTKIEDVIKPLLYHFAVIFIVLLLVTYIPALSLWLPGLLGYVK